MIRQTEEPTREAIPDPVLAGYRLGASPRRREGGSLLFTATAPDGSPAAVQVSAEPLPNRRARARFRRLARARAALRHPALLEVRQVGDEGGRPFVATEPFPERSLADLLRDGPLDLDRALSLLRVVADGLDAAHAAKLVHRTLSPESVLLDGERVKLDLFGVFTTAGTASWGDVVRRDAHLHYDSPEGVRGEDLTPASNVYSLTGLLVHALTGQQPFVHHDPVMISYAHVSKPPPKPSERNAALPGGLDAIVARGMAKDPSERPDSAGALIAGAALVLRTLSHTRPKPALSDPPPPARLTTPAPAPRSSAAPARAPASPAAPAKPPAPAPVASAAPAKPPAPAPVASAAPAKPPAPVASAAPPKPPAPTPVSPAAPRKAFAPAPSKPPAWPPAPAPVSPAEARPPLRRPLKARLAPWAPLALVVLLAASFGVLLGMPGAGSEQAATTMRSPEERAVQRLDDVRFRLRDDLAFASTADEQADAAQRLAMAYGRAADHLSSPGLVSAAQRASAAYASLEGAARAADEDGYESARGDVEAAESEIAGELSRLNRQSRRRE